MIKYQIYILPSSTTKYRGFYDLIRFYIYIKLTSLYYDLCTMALMRPDNECAIVRPIKLSNYHDSLQILT